MKSIGCGLIVGFGVLAIILLMFNLFTNFAPNQKAPVQYVEVKGKKGLVTIHTGMPKDSVRILVGKPDKVDLHTVGSVSIENWGYVINNHYDIADLNIDFKNGSLTEVHQR